MKINSNLKAFLVIAAAFGVGLGSYTLTHKNISNELSSGRGIASVGGSGPVLMGKCAFSTVGWVKTYGKESIEVTRDISADNENDLVKKCHETAMTYVDEHFGEGAVAFDRVLSPNPRTASN